MRPAVLDLFAGYGGFSLAFDAAGFRTIGFSEIDPYASAILAHRFPDVPNLGDVRTITRAAVLERCGVLPAVVTGGFPCQPHSAAGKRLASADERDLWDECVRVLRELRPRVALFENVRGLLSSQSFTDAADGSLDKGLFFNRVLSDLAEIGYACAWQVVSAADVGAPHRRERVWLLCVDELADGGVAGLQGRVRRGAAGAQGPSSGYSSQCGNAAMADGERPRLQGYAWDGADGHEPRWIRTVAHGSVGEGSVRGEWPAARGLWPARPGEAQFGWEPPRVVGGMENAASIGRGGRDDGVDGGQGRALQAAVSRPQRDTEAADNGEAQSRLGGNADGPPHRLDATADEVSEAPNRTHRLKAIGNGIVPAVAYPFAVALRRYLDGIAP